MHSHVAAAPRLLRTIEAAMLLGLAPSTLEKLRCSGGGPRYSKLGPKAVAYFEQDLLDWAKSNARYSTSGSEGNPARPAVSRPPGEIENPE
jgi:predicted DNA-binding transcriptional regulator AlpA